VIDPGRVVARQWFGILGVADERRRYNRFGKARLIASGAVVGDGSSRRPSGRHRLPGALAGVVVGIVGLTGLGVQAVRGNRTVSIQRDAVTIHDAALDDAYYNCLDVQTHSLVPTGEPVALGGGLTVSNLGSLITLLKASGSWLTFADPPSSAAVQITLRNDVPGHGACLGTVVVATSTHPGPGVRVRIGSGSSVPGQGPPPAPPL